METATLNAALHLRSNKRKHKGQGPLSINSLALSIILILLTLVLFSLGFYIGKSFMIKKEQVPHLSSKAADIFQNRSPALRGIHDFTDIPKKQGVDEYNIASLRTTINPNSLSEGEFLKSSLQAAFGTSYMETSFLLDLQTRTVISTWVFLSPDYSNDNMRTIFSNKKSGCRTEVERGGIAMFVNPWLGDDLQLYIEYGNELSGCNKIQSGVSLAIAKWTHVAGIYLNIFLSCPLNFLRLSTF